MTNDLRLTFIGSGNAFSPGGLCCSGFAVNEKILFDTPPQTLSSMNTVGLDPNAIETVVLSHHHGDHFLGLPFLLLHWRWRGRQKPVRIIGPRGTQALATKISEMVFPGVLETVGYDLEWDDVPPGKLIRVGDLELEPHQMTHDDGLDICLGYAARLGGRRFSYTGDTILCDAVLELAKDQEVMVSECASRANRIPVHMNLVDDIPVVRAALPKDAKLLLTHVDVDVKVDADILPNTEVAKDFATYTF